MYKVSPGRAVYLGGCLMARAGEVLPTTVTADQLSFWLEKGFIFKELLSSPDQNENPPSSDESFDVKPKKKKGRPKKKENSD